jgi:hypothetical protein
MTDRYFDQVIVRKYVSPEPTTTVGSEDISDITPLSDITTVRDDTDTDIDYTSSNTELSANWDASNDAESGIARYWDAIGTAQYPNTGWDSVVGWTDNGVSTSVTVTGLSLTTGTTYYFTVKAENNAGLQSSATNSDGCTVVVPTPDLSAPLDSGYVLTATPTFKLSATDPDSGTFKFKIELGADNFATIKYTSDLVTTTERGWSASSYASGTTAEYTIGPDNELRNGATYYWRAYTYDTSNAS